MNLNDVLAQQQAVLNQLAQNAQHWELMMMVLGLAPAILGFWITYLFYARLRDIAHELMKFRIAYEFAQERDARMKSPSQTPNLPFPSAPCPGKPPDAKYMPRS